MKAVLIFGIGGFTGQHLENFISRQELSSEYKFFGADIEFKNAIESGCFQYISCDVTSKKDVFKTLETVKPNYIINLVGSFSAKSIEDYIALNLIPTGFILDGCSELNLPVEKILLVGSAAEYGIPSRNPIEETDPVRPVNPYGLSKCFQTQLGMFYFRTKGLPVTIARTFNIIGEGISEYLSIGNFMRQIEQAKDGDTILTGNLSSKRDFLSIDEVVQLYWQLVVKGSPGEVYNVCSGKSTQMSVILNKLIDNSGKQLNQSTNPSQFKTFDVDEIFGSNDKLSRLNENSSGRL